MDPTLSPFTPTRHRRLSRAALVPLLVALIAVGALALGTADATPAPAKGVHHVEKSEVPVELGPATVVVP